MLALSLPGHLSYDSVAQLHEGRFHLRETWGPAMYAWLLGAFDRIWPGTALYLIVSGLVFYGSLAALSNLRPRVLWLAPLLAVVLVCAPALLVYQAIVWKDVAFANCAIAGAVLVSHASLRWETPRLRWSLLLLALPLLAVAALVRQNGLVVAACLAPALAWRARAGGRRAALLWGAGPFLAVVVASQGLGLAVQPPASGPDLAINKGVRIVQHYDLLGAVARDPSFALPALRRANPEAEAVVRSKAGSRFSPQRIDYADSDPGLNTALWSLPSAAVRADWLRLVSHRPDLYLRNRLEIFWWVLATPDLKRCLPVYTGVDAPAEMMRDLGLHHRFSATDAALSEYAVIWGHTPFYSHLASALAALVVAVLLARRRDPADLPILGLMVSALGFAASFFLISIACDYRYLYFVDLAATTGVLYLACDPPRLRGPRLSERA
jgi:hypothetical protein